MAKLSWYCAFSVSWLAEAFGFAMKLLSPLTLSLCVVHAIVITNLELNYSLSWASWRSSQQRRRVVISRYYNPILFQFIPWYCRFRAQRVPDRTYNIFRVTKNFKQRIACKIKFVDWRLGLYRIMKIFQSGGSCLPFLRWNKTNIADAATVCVCVCVYFKIILSWSNDDLIIQAFHHR